MCPTNIFTGLHHIATKEFHNCHLVYVPGYTSYLLKEHSDYGQLTVIFCRLIQSTSDITHHGSGINQISFKACKFSCCALYWFEGYEYLGEYGESLKTSVKESPYSFMKTT